MDIDDSTALNLDPLFISGLVVPVYSGNAVGGVNYNMLHSHERGLLVQVQPYLNMEEGDWIAVFWGDETNAVASDRVLPEHVGEPFSLFIGADRIPDGISEVWYVITRSGSGNEESSTRIGILVRTEFPGDTDPEPDLPGHQNLPAPEPELPPSGIIDEEAAKNGVKVTISAYPNMREFDQITFSWGGQLLTHDVTQDEVNAGSLDILVTEATILAAGDSDDLVLVYRVRDEVHNFSSDWSIRTLIHVEVGKGLFGAPAIENPDPAADPYDVIDLAVLGDADLSVEVYAVPGGQLQVDDAVALTWVGTTAQGETIPVTPPEQTVPRLPVTLKFPIANAAITSLGGGRGVASYTVTRDGIGAGASKRTFATFLGEAQLLPKPTVVDAVNGVLDPTLTETTVIIPGDALGAGDTLLLTWLGVRANGTPLLKEISRPISGGEAGKPLNIPILGAEFIAPLDGGTLSVHYTVTKYSRVVLESDREHLTVGEAQAELPPPFTRPAAEDGVLDPEELPAQLELVVAPWPGMAVDQELHIFWRASVGTDYYNFMPITPPLVGQEVVFYLDRSHVEGNLGANIEITYRVERPEGPDQLSSATRFRIAPQQQIEDGPLRIMGARFNPAIHFGSSTPRMITALHDETLELAPAQWRYEDSPEWTIASRWNDGKPWLKLYVRSASETWVCQPVNIIGTGWGVSSSGQAAFVAMRDEVIGDEGPRVDMVAWGHPEHGGLLTADAAAAGNVRAIAATSGAFAALLRDGNVLCWGYETAGGVPSIVAGDFVEIVSNSLAFAGRQQNGDLFAWGRDGMGVPVPDRVLRHKDYVELRGASRAFAARRASGHVVAWGDPDQGGELHSGQDEFDDIVQLAGNIAAFAALRERQGARSVIAWGNIDQGGFVPEEIARRSDVQSICASALAFCVLLETGAVKAWPTAMTGEMPEEIAALRNVIEVSATAHAFCVRLDNGQIRAWGAQPHGGEMPEEYSEISDVVQVVGNAQAFAALRSNGQVIAWGNPASGGDISAVAQKLVNVRAIYGNTHAFSALTKEGHVVTWGVSDGGGDSSTVQDQLNGKVTARRLLSHAEAEAVSRGEVTVDRRS